METTIFLCTLMICLTALIITTMLSKQRNKATLQIWSAIEAALKEITGLKEYQAFLKSVKDEKDEQDEQSDETGS